MRWWEKQRKAKLAGSGPPPSATGSRWSICSRWEEVQRRPVSGSRYTQRPWSRCQTRRRTAAGMWRRGGDWWELRTEPRLVCAAATADDAPLGVGRHRDRGPRSGSGGSTLRRRIAACALSRPGRRRDTARPVALRRRSIAASLSRPGRRRGTARLVALRRRSIAASLSRPGRHRGRARPVALRRRRIAASLSRRGGGACKVRRPHRGFVSALRRPGRCPVSTCLVRRPPR